MTFKKLITSLCAVSLAAGPAITGWGGIILAKDKEGSRYFESRKEPRKDTRKHIKKDKHHSQREREREHYKKHHSSPHVIRRGPSYAWPKKRVRHYRGIQIIRPYGRWYPGYGHIHIDNDAYFWLAFTAITLKILDNLNEQQQRAHEASQVRATTAAIGEKIIWSNGGAHGSVTATREGTSTTGRYCREFLQEVSIGGKTERAYGTACRQPDGSWEVVSTEIFD